MRKSLHHRNKGFILYALLLGFGLLVLPSACGTDSEASQPSPTESAPMPTPTLDLSGGGSQSPAPSIEYRQLTLEFPPKIRAGDADLIRLTLEVDEHGNLTPTAEIDGHEVTGETIEVEDLYETHYIIAESRLDMAGVQVVPPGLISEPLLPEESVTFYWSISTPDAGNYLGTVWFYLRYIPKDGGAESRRAVSAQRIEIVSTKFFDVLSADAAKKIGAIGSFLGAVLGFPFVDDILKFFWGKVKG